MNVNSATTTQPQPATVLDADAAPTIPAGSPLLQLGRRRDLGTEKGVLCPGDLPPPNAPDLAQRIRAAKAALGDDVVILGHHYQRDDVIQFADSRGDSFALSQFAADATAKTIVFCGVHFMAESASILAREDQTVLLPDLAAGCSMADMADIRQVHDAHKRLERAGVTDSMIPVTYMNSTAALKGYTGEHGGTVCTSSNAERALRWAFEQGERVFFFPDEHLGRNTAVLRMGMSLEDCVVYNPWQPDGGLTDEQLRNAKMILWKGHCSVHARFRPEMIDALHAEHPDAQVYAHPECRYDVVRRSDRVGSTSQILEWITEASAGSKIAVATELNLVKRIADENPDKHVMFLDDTVCFCATMNRIDMPHLTWVLENLVQGNVINEVRVDPTVRTHAKAALDQMLALPAA